MNYGRGFLDNTGWHTLVSYLQDILERVLQKSDVNLTNNTQQQHHPKPDSTVPSPPADKVVEAGGGGGQTASSDTLADLASTEISLDLQGLIDDDHFSADAENLFGDLMDQGGHGGHKRDFVRLSPVNSLGSSAHSSPGEHHHHHHPQDSPPSFSNPYR